LRKDPALRFQTMKDVKNDLAEMSSRGAVLGPVAMAGSSAAIHEQTPSIAVLPFTNLSAEKENEYFSDGLAEEIMNALAKIPELKVIARTSAFAFRGKEHDLRTIGERLRVGTILEGSVRRARNRVRVTAQLIRVADESHLWSERYDREMTDIFAIQDEISQAIADALKVKLITPQRGTANVEAFQYYLKGMYWYQRYTAESLPKAEESFQQALNLDPNYALAYAGLAGFYYGLGALSIKRMTDVAPLAKSTAEKALAIDPTLNEALGTLGLIRGTVEYDWRATEAHFQKAVAVAPVPPLVRLRYAFYCLTPQRRLKEAEEQVRLALENDPLSMMLHFGFANTLYCDRQYDRALEYASKAVEMFPDHWMLHYVMGLVLSANGMWAEAVASLEKGARLSPRFALMTGYLAAAHARLGESDKAEKLIAELKERARTQFVSSVGFSIYYAAIGETEKVFESLNAAFAERDPALTRMNTEPYCDPYQTDARFIALMKKMNLS
jgi:TolB-like protein/Tfp pilus assembly protein PilF